MPRRVHAAISRAPISWPPGDQWIANRTRMTMIERCTAPLSNVVRLGVRRADGGEQLLDLFATDKRLLLHPSSGQ
jgi:hypothetical protein